MSISVEYSHGCEGHMVSLGYDVWLGNP